MSNSDTLSKILEENTLCKSVDKSDLSNSGDIMMAFLLLISLTIYIICFIFSPNNDYANEYSKIDMFRYDLVIYFSFLFVIVFLFCIILTYLERKENNYSYTKHILSKKTWMLSFFIGLVALSLYVNIHRSLIDSKYNSAGLKKLVKGGEKSINRIVDSISLLGFLIDTIDELSILLAGIFFVFTLKEIIIVSAQFKLDSAYLDINVSYEKIYFKLLKLLHRSSDVPFDDDYKKCSRLIFLNLSNNKRHIKIEALAFLLGSSIAAEIFDVFEHKKSDCITEKEFTEGYIKLVRTKNNVRSIFKQNASLIRKLDIITSIFMVFLLILVYYVTVHGISTKKTLVSNLSSILSLNFIFGSIITDLFRNIIYIFFVHPFGSGDLLKIKGKYYEVVEMGLISSLFLIDSKYVLISNKKISSYEIINYRQSQAEEKSFVFKLNASKYEENKKEIKNIEEIIQKHPRIFDRNLKIKNGLNSDDLIDVDFCFSFKIYPNNIEKNISNKNKCALMIVKLLKKHDLEIY